jgi:hypothetical protein
MLCAVLSTLACEALLAPQHGATRGEDVVLLVLQAFYRIEVRLLADWSMHSCDYVSTNQEVPKG